MDITKLIASVIFEQNESKKGYKWGKLTINLANGVNTEYLLSNDQLQLLKLTVGQNNNKG